jgi:recombination DNA repair RAD52 pathway protein
MFDEYGINQTQYEQLLKPLHPSRVAKRSQAGRQLSYLEAWDVKAHLIRIFGFGGWSWTVIKAEVAFEEQNEKGQWNVGYKVIGRLYISQLGCEYTEAAVGSASIPQRGEAHDMAIKTAESDALKRAAINLGTQFGLSLYNDGSLADVVRTTLDKAAPTEEQIGLHGVDEVDEPPAVPDNEDSGIWIERMKSLIADSDVSALLELKKEMNTNEVNDWVFQGVTLAKWLDKAIAQTGKGK